jgi:hypothetical protein
MKRLICFFFVEEKEKKKREREREKVKIFFLLSLSMSFCARLTTNENKRQNMSQSLISGKKNDHDQHRLYSSLIFHQ